MYGAYDPGLQKIVPWMGYFPSHQLAKAAFPPYYIPKPVNQYTVVGFRGFAGELRGVQYAGLLNRMATSCKRWWISPLSLTETEVEDLQDQLGEEWKVDGFGAQLKEAV